MISKTLQDSLFADLKKDVTISQPASQPPSLLLMTLQDLDLDAVLRVPRVVSNAISIKTAAALTQYLASPPAKRSFALAIVVCDSTDTTEIHYVHLLSRLRDTDSARVYLACRGATKAADKKHDAHLRALGFRLLRVYKSDDANEPSVYLYYYDIYDYKEVPDWLNDRFWANPERWGKERW